MKSSVPFEHLTLVATCLPQDGPSERECAVAVQGDRANVALKGPEFLAIGGKPQDGGWE